MLSLKPRERFYRTQSGIAFIINIIPVEDNTKDFIGVHVSKVGLGYRYDTIWYKVDGTCPGYSAKFALIEPTTIKASGFTEWYEACMRATHPTKCACSESNASIITARTDSGDEIFIISPAPKDANDYYSFLVSKNPRCDELELCDIRKYGPLKFKWVLVRTAFAYDNPSKDFEEVAEGANIEFDEEAIELGASIKPRRVAPKSEVFELLETSNPEKFVLCNIETEEVFVISKNKLKDYVEF